MNERRSNARRAARRTTGRWVVGCAAALALAGCTPPDDNAANTDVTIDIQREGREEGDVETEVGETIEVHGITATITEVGRVDAYNDLDTSGYIWARIEVENTTSREVDFHRRHVRLEKPDGSLSNTANISTETQLEGSSTARASVLEPGETAEGQVIYTAGDLEGQFAIVYLPPSPTDDELDQERGVWVFESGPEDAE